MKMPNVRSTTALALAAAGLAGCVGSIEGPMSPAWGEALASVNAQAQPVQVSDLPPETSGQAAAAAIERYHRGETKPVPTYATSSVGATIGAGEPQG